MGDILGGVFGSGKNTDQTTTPDAEAKALNKMKLAELQDLFGVAGMSDFAGANKKDFTLSSRTDDLISDNLISLEDYLAKGLDAGKSYLSEVATPEIMGQLAMQGMDRSGAAPEAIAKATAGMAMPFLQSIPSFMQASTGNVGMSDMPRQLRVEDFMRQQGVVQTGFTGIPFAPGSKTVGNENTLPMFHMFGTG